MKQACYQLDEVVLKPGYHALFCAHVMGIMKMTATSCAYAVIIEITLLYFDPTSKIEATLVYYIHVTFSEYI